MQTAQQTIALLVIAIVAAILWASPEDKPSKPGAPAKPDLCGFWACSGTIETDDGPQTYETVVIIRAHKDAYELLWAAGNPQRGIGIVRGGFLDVGIAFPSGHPALARYEISEKQLKGVWQSPATKGTEVLTFLRK